MSTKFEKDIHQIFGHGFGTITDIEIGPNDGFPYVFTFDGTIYRIVPNTLMTVK